jgi:transposase
MGKKAIRSYTSEFKRQALNLAKELGPTKAARHLGIRDANIHNWRKKEAEVSLPTADDPKALAEENRKLREKVLELEKVNHILKRAAAFFSQDHLK